MKLNVAVFFGILAVLYITLLRNNFFPKVIASETCPDNGGWVKIDSGDLSLYPVTGVTQYCFKAGDWSTVSAIPTGGFGQDGPCNQNIKNCDLSHWSYFDPGFGTPTPTSTPTSTATNRCSHSPTPTATPTGTATATPTATPTATATATSDPCNGDCNEPTETPTSTPVATETPNGDICANIDGIQTSLPEGSHLDASGKNCVWFGVPGVPESTGGTNVLGASTTSQVLGATTMAGTGAVEDAIFNSIFTLGSILTSFGIMKNGKKNKKV